MLNPSAPHHHISGTCYGRHTASTHIGALFRPRLGVMTVSVTRTCVRRQMPSPVVARATPLPRCRGPPHPLEHTRQFLRGSTDAPTCAKSTEHQLRLSSRRFQTDP